MDGRPQPFIEGATPGSMDTPVDSCRNAQIHDLVPRRENFFSAIAGLVAIDGIVGWRPLNRHGVGALTADGGQLGTFIDDFNRLCRAGRSVPRIGRRQPAMALAVGIGPRLEASRRAGPHKTNTQR